MAAGVHSRASDRFAGAGDMAWGRRGLPSYALDHGGYEGTGHWQGWKSEGFSMWPTLSFTVWFDAQLCNSGDANLFDQACPTRFALIVHGSRMLVPLVAL